MSTKPRKPYTRVIRKPPSVGQMILSMTADIDEFKGHWPLLQKTPFYKLDQLRDETVVDSTGASLRFDGLFPSQELLSYIILDGGTTAEDDALAIAIQAFAAAWKGVYTDHPEMDEAMIVDLYRRVIPSVHEDGTSPYKKEPNGLVAYDQSGRRLGLVLMAAPPEEVPRLLADLIEWTQRALLHKTHHPLLVIARFMLHFLSIAPFEKGNSRMAQLLTLALFLRSGYTYMQLASLPAMMEVSKGHYYVALQKTQGKLVNDSASMDAWLLFFLRSLRKQKDTILEKISAPQEELKVHPLAKDILELAKQKGRITISDAYRTIPSNRRTIGDHLARLVRSRHLIKHGQRKATWYSLGALSW